MYAAARRGERASAHEHNVRCAGRRRGGGGRLGARSFLWRCEACFAATVPVLWSPGQRSCEQAATGERAADGAMASVVTFSRKSRKVGARRGRERSGRAEPNFFALPARSRRCPPPACGCTNHAVAISRGGRLTRRTTHTRRRRRRQAMGAPPAVMPAARPPPTSPRPRC